MRRITFLLLMFAFADAKAAVPTFAQVQAAYRSSDAWLLDRHGEVLQTVRVDTHVRRLPWVKLSEVSPALRTAVLLSEDQRFAEHDGVDWQAMLNAAWGNARGQHVRGASTISMQVAALLDARLQPQGARRSLGQKWDQIARARELERAWSKPQILEAYFNLVSYRGELQGIAAAAQQLFGKTPSGLDRVESALLAALIRSPNAPAAMVVRRACALAETMQAGEACEARRAQLPTLLDHQRGVSLAAQDAPQLAQQLLKTPGQRLRSTIDGDLQRDAEEALRTHLLALRARNVHDGALVVLDNASGEVLAYVANLGEASSAPSVDGVRALLQAGSTLKPFLYGLAFEQRLLTAASILEDTPVNLVTPTGLYVPQNYDKDFKGPVSVRTALASSLNIPAVRTAMLVGVERFHQRLRDVGLQSLTESGEYYGYSLALGSGEVRLLDLANAYRVLANGGRYTPVRFDPAAPRAEPRRVMDASAAFIVADILADREARSTTFGLENPLATRHWSAVKTGTSKQMRDNWCVGFSARYTVAVWVGNFDGEPMWQVSGITGAAPVWLAMMHRLHGDLPSAAPSAPQRLVRQTVSFEGRLETTREEWFIAGTERAHVALAKPSEASAHIQYPGGGSILAYDPDIPAAHQRVLFRAEAVDGRLQWQLNGEMLGGVDDAVAWQPRPGHFHLVLRDRTGREVDAVDFEVRGGATRQP